MAYKLEREPLPPASFDLTPMIDCVFQLIIFFMVTTVFKNPAQLNLTLPMAENPTQLEKSQIVVELNEEGTLSVQGNEASWDVLDTYMVNEKQKLGANGVLIKADENAKHGDVLRIMKIARSVEIEVLNLAVDTEVEK